jgi:hypothetical protein
MTILGFQVVLLDEQGQELERIPDVYGDDSWIVIGDYGYLLERTIEEEGQRVRYFKRKPDEPATRRYGATYCGPYDTPKE